MAPSDHDHDAALAATTMPGDPLMRGLNALRLEVDGSIVDSLRELLLVHDHLLSAKVLDDAAEALPTDEPLGPWLRERAERIRSCAHGAT